jgi:hypothetical protein
MSIYFSTPSFCPLIVLVLSENLNLSACLFFSLAMLAVFNSAKPVVTEAVFIASRLFMMDLVLNTN